MIISTLEQKLTKQKKILVLGSEGLIGKSLCRKLELSGHKVFHIDKKINHDILCEYDSGMLDQYIFESDFVFFLAFDVGGAKYLSKNEHTFDFISKNTRMMEKVFDGVREYSKPFIFISSMMTKMPQSTYGILKSLGERYTKSLGGLSIRFWNVYGYEKIEQDKNHVITDFIVSGLNNKEINCMTDGSEVRQFIHADDAAEALEIVMNNYKSAIRMSANDLNCIDITNNKWTSIKLIGEHIASITKSKINFSESKDKVQKDLKIDADTKIIEVLGWKEKIDLCQGINNLINIYKIS